MKKKYSAQLKTWHEIHSAERTFGQRIADSISNGMGSWTFIIIQTIFVLGWMACNLIGYLMHWDPYPFILLNLLFSTQAAYAAPIIMMSQKRQNERDRLQAMDDYQTNLEAKLEIEELQRRLNRIETDKLDKILAILERGK
ncbi:MAG: DUF1003 domain-containing protein [Sediminibacterium sp.]|jgi:uncharacterized membrane protein|nr:DUF1003 domain-containing protein [uncultured Sediminibacterium sp.]